MVDVREGGMRDKESRGKIVGQEGMRMGEVMWPDMKRNEGGDGRARRALDVREEGVWEGEVKGLDMRGRRR